MVDSVLCCGKSHPLFALMLGMFDCVGLFYAFANAVYIFANIGANAEMLAFYLCEWCVLNALNAVANLIRFCS